jgi:hypothetical protein
MFALIIRIHLFELGLDPNFDLNLRFNNMTPGDKPPEVKYNDPITVQKVYIYGAIGVALASFLAFDFYHG